MNDIDVLKAGNQRQAGRHKLHGHKLVFKIENGLDLYGALFFRVRTAQDYPIGNNEDSKTDAHIFASQIKIL